jgi:PKD repeat protein
MKKSLLALMGMLSLTTCVHEVPAPVSVISVEITPPGDSTAATLTSRIRTSGQGTIKIDWKNACYDSVSTAKTQEIVVDTDGIYLSTLSSGLGWYWVDIFNESDSLLWHTDSVFCGPDTALPKPDFFPDWTYGSHPLTVTFYIQADSNAYTKAFWNFADSSTSTEWEPVHTFENPGEYNVILVLRNLAGAAKDSTLIYVW